MKRDVWGHEKKYLNWKKNPIVKDVSSENQELILEYISDMESGYHVGRPGGLSYARLNNLRQRMRWIALQMEQSFKKNLGELTRKDVSKFFNEYMRKGYILTNKGNRYTSVRDYANVFKAFWHWYQKREDENGNSIKDITTYIDMGPVEENKFAYFTIEEFKRVVASAKFDYKVMMWFMFDSGIRAPTELMNIKVEDLTWREDENVYEVNIREEVAKTFGRRPKLLLCSNLIKEYLEVMNLGNESYLFNIDPTVAKRYIQRLFVRVLGDFKTKGGKFIREIRLYDFRHSSACYWLPRYKSESAFKFRFGWVENSIVHYYTKLLGMKDTIVEQDILLETEARTKLEKRITVLENEIKLRDEQREVELAEIKKFLKPDLFKESLKAALKELFAKVVDSKLQKYPKWLRNDLRKELLDDFEKFNELIE